MRTNDIHRLSGRKLTTQRRHALKSKLTAVLALVACTLAAVASTASATAKASSLKIYALTSDRTAFEAVLAVYKKSHPGLKISITYADVTPYQSTLRTQLAAGTAADVFEVWPGNGNPGAIQVLAPYHFLADLSKQPFAKREPAGIKSVTHVGGKLYTVPLGLSGLGPIYNMSVLNQLGVSAPTTWSQVLTLCSKAKTAGIAAYALGNQDDWVTQLVPYALVPTTVYDKQPNFDALLRAGKTSFPKSGWSTAENLYEQMNNAGCFQSNPLATNYAATQTMLATGKAAGLVQGSWAFSDVKKQAPAGTQFKMFPLPATNDPKQTRMAGAPSAAFAVNAKTKNPEAMKFMDFLASPKAQTTFAKASGNLPAYASKTFKPDPSLSVFVGYLRAGKTNPFMDQLWPNPKVQQAHLKGLQDVFAGKESMADVLNAMQSAYTSK
jgi:raffinose/stachyose/melibiose transport system substrate-binding protein